MIDIKELYYMYAYYDLIKKLEAWLLMICFIHIHLYITPVRFNRSGELVVKNRWVIIFQVAQYPICTL